MALPAGSTATRTAGLFTVAILGLLVSPVYAQEVEPSGDTTAYLENLRNCQAVQADAERLACFDREVEAMVAATETGEVRVVDREEVQRTRRSLFGFKLPDLGLFGNDGGEDENELFETSITDARYLGRKKVRFTTAEGAVWEMNNVPRRLRTIEPGDPVIFKPATLGYYFVRIDGQMGVKGRRVE